MIMYFLAFSLLISCTFSAGNVIKYDCIKDRGFSTLQEEFILQRNSSIDPCTDAYSFMCSEDTRKKSLEDGLSNMTTYIINLLNSPHQSNDSELLKVEKSLYQSCIQSENEDNRDDADYVLLNSQLRNLLDIKKWQDIELKLFSLGLGYSFFDMKVIPHPEYEAFNTILLQPPSHANIKSMVNRFKQIRVYRNRYRKKQYLGKAESIHNLYNFLDENDEPNVLHFFEILEKAKLGISDYSGEFPVFYTTVKEFNKMQAHVFLKPDVSIKADWIQVIHESLEKMSITFETDDIILKNPKYFLSLTMLLRETPNDVVEKAIQTKSVTDNLAYFNWDLYNLLETIDRSDFCFKETKLYGASRTLVHDWVKEKDAELIGFVKEDNILSNIVNTIRNEISSYKPFTTTLYKRKLYSTFESLREYVYEPPYNFYEKLNISSAIYFKNIIEYRKLLLHNDLEYLQDKYDAFRPFSFVDQDEPKNRFIIGILIHIAGVFAPELPKEVHYGSFGVGSAALIHALLHEDTFNEEWSNEITDELTYPKYSKLFPRTEYCISHEGNFYNSGDIRSDIISQTMAINTAFNALMQDSDVSFHSISNTVLSSEKITKGKLFFLAYIKDNCFLNDKVLNTILSGNSEFNKTFDCRRDPNEDLKTCILSEPTPDVL